MNIIYQPNPLATIVELDDHDREVLKLKLIINDVNETFVEAYFHLTEGKNYNPSAAKKLLLCDDDLEEKQSAKATRLLNICQSELRKAHVGDCICVPCSCVKCYAESFLGINTIKDLRKHEASHINSAFNSGKTLDEVIKHLENYADAPKPGWAATRPELYESSLPRFLQEATAAAIWLKEYSAAHFNKDLLIDTMPLPERFK